MTTSTSPQRRSARSTPRRLAALLVVLVVAPAAALAGKTEAEVHVANATRAHREGRYEQARVELEAAYALAPRPALLYALGQVHAKLGNCQEAIRYYVRYGATQNDPRVAKVVDQAIAACKPARASAEPLPGAASPRPDQPPPSAHTPSPPALPATPFGATRVAPVPFTVEQRSPWYKDKLGDGLVLGGVAAAVVGLVEYRSALADLDAAESRASTTTLARYQELVDRAHSKRTASFVLLGAGGALITGGIVRYVVRSATSEVSGVAIAPAPGGGMVSFAGRF